MWPPEARTEATEAVVRKVAEALADAERGGWMWAEASDIGAPEPRVDEWIETARDLVREVAELARQ